MFLTVCTGYSGRPRCMGYDADMIEVTFFPILAAGIVSAVIGFVWYHPRVFGSAWMRMSNITPEMVERGIWSWIGFVAPAMLGQVLWEQKPFSLYLINVGYWLVSFVAMAIVLLFLFCMQFKKFFYGAFAIAAALFVGGGF